MAATAPRVILELIVGNFGGWKTPMREVTTATTLTSVAATVEVTLVLTAIKQRSTIVQINAAKQA
jgi:hypothetical protein